MLNNLLPDEEKTRDNRNVETDDWNTMEQTCEQFGSFKENRNRKDNGTQNQKKAVEISCEHIEERS